MTAAIRQFVGLPLPADGTLKPRPAVTVIQAYELVLFAYLTSLLYFYPYGVPVGGNASVRVPDILGLPCFLLGSAAVIAIGRVHTSRLFFLVVGPFLFLELATPVLGALGYRSLSNVVSTVRMALLWMPMIFLTWLAPLSDAERFERRLARLMILTLWMNLVYALAQIAVDLGYAPRWLAFTKFLEPWTVDRQFDVVVGLRPAGFFVNTTALSTFAIIALCFFYARYVSSKTARDLRFALLSFLLVVVTTSRAAAAAALLILLLGWVVLSGGRKLAFAVALGCVVIALLAVVEKTIGIEQAFSRFQRLAESGILADVSFGHRFYTTWPAALAIAHDYPFGTLISAPRIATLIDSGYLTYYVQGKWLFVAVVAVMLLFQWTIGLRGLANPTLRPGRLMLLFVTAFLSIAMVITNPLRSPLLIFFLVFVFWKIDAERQSRAFILLPGSRR